MLRHIPIAIWAVVAASIGACDSDTAPADSGVDGGGMDAAGGPRDAGPRDAGTVTPTDAAGTDTGTVELDSGSELDGGSTDLDAGDSGGTSPTDASVPADAATCRTPSDCQDSVFCNGLEACAPGVAGADARGCVAGPAPCAGGATCDETTDRCVFCGSCTGDPDCSDGTACNGRETCATGTCRLGTTITCPGARTCVEPSGGCSCTSDPQCSDGIACNGVERCMGGACRPGTTVICAIPETCEELIGGCGEFCLNDSDCDDGAYCNGVERCASGVCARGTSPCGARGCNETTNRCRCASDADCTDSLYCSDFDRWRVEGCNTISLECVPIAGVCPAGQYCFESMDRCRSLACVTAADCGIGCWSCTGGSCVGRHCPVDADADGHDAEVDAGDDCDDTNRNRYPGNPEICDTGHVDEDCNLATFGRRDMDVDGFPDDRCCNAETCGTDCDDARSSVHPTATEACNGIDDDCDDAIDETVLLPFFRDRDMDGAGDSACGSTFRFCAVAPGYAATGGDCDDGNPAIRVGTSSCDPSGPGVRVCRAGGVWEAQPCSPGTTCRPQPDGTGLCL